MVFTSAPNTKERYKNFKRCSGKQFKKL